MVWLFVREDKSDCLFDFIDFIAFVEFFIDDIVNMNVNFLEPAELFLELPLQLLVFCPKMLVL